MDMCKFESSQKDESRAQSTDSSKAYKNTSAFRYSSHGFKILLKRSIIRPYIAGQCSVFTVHFVFPLYVFSKLCQVLQPESERVFDSVPSLRGALTPILKYETL